MSLIGNNWLDNAIDNAKTFLAVEFEKIKPLTKEKYKRCYLSFDDEKINTDISIRKNENMTKSEFLKIVEDIVFENAYILMKDFDDKKDAENYSEFMNRFSK